MSTRTKRAAPTKSWTLVVSGASLEGRRYVDARAAHAAMCDMIQDWIDFANAFDRVNVQHLHEELLKCRNQEHTEAHCDILVDTHWKRRFTVEVRRIEPVETPSLL